MTAKRAIQIDFSEVGARARKKLSHKRFQLDNEKIRRAQHVLHTKTATETIERALDFVIDEHKRNRMANDANVRFVLKRNRHQGRSPHSRLNVYDA
jgi:hypothetical protein